MLFSPSAVLHGQVTLLVDHDDKLGGLHRATAIFHFSYTVLV